MKKQKRRQLVRDIFHDNDGDAQSAYLADYRYFTKIMRNIYVEMKYCGCCCHF